MSSTSSMLSRLCESEPVQRHQRQHLLQVRQQRRAEQRAARQRPVAVALHGVDLAVVREIAVRVREAPLRQRVGREALVEHRHRGSPGAGRRGRDRTAPGTAASPCPCRRWCWRTGSARRRPRPPRRRLLGEAPRHEQPAVEGGLVEVRRRAVHEQLLDVRQRLQRLGAAGLGVDRHHAPAGHLQPLARQLRLQRGARRPRPAPASRTEEYQPGGEALRRARCRPRRPPRAGIPRDVFSSRPQPSPVLPSAAMAPRCVRRLSEVIAVCTSQWLGASSRLAIRPKPQLSRS